MVPMWYIKLNSRRRATFPARVCDALKLVPGARIRLERGVIAGKVVYFLRPTEPELAWIGCAREKTSGKSHRWTAIRSSIESGWAEDRKPRASASNTGWPGTPELNC